jgi:hypothetical protein
MESSGYPQKSNKYVIDYCVQGRLWLKRVFLHESGERKDVFTMTVKYFVNSTAEDAKGKFA